MLIRRNTSGQDVSKLTSLCLINCFWKKLKSLNFVLFRLKADTLISSLIVSSPHLPSKCSPLSILNIR